MDGHRKRRCAGNESTSAVRIDPEMGGRGQTLIVVCLMNYDGMGTAAGGGDWERG